MRLLSEPEQGGARTSSTDSTCARSQHLVKLKSISDSLPPEKEEPICEGEAEAADLNRAQQLRVLRQSEQPNNRTIKTQTQILQELQLRADRHYYERLVRDQVRQLTSETERSKTEGTAVAVAPPKDEAQVRKE